MIHSVKYNFAMNIILQLSSLIFPLITLPYITRTLGAVNNGKVSFVISVITYFSMFAQLGIPTYGIRECARCRDDRSKLTKTVHELMAINLVSAVISYIALAISILFVKKFQADATLLLINSITIVLNMLGMEWLYRSIEQYKYITIRNLFFKAFAVALMFLLVRKPEDYMIYGVLTMVSSSGSYLLNFVYSRKILEHRFYFGEYEFAKHLRPICTFFALSIAISVYAGMDTIMLGFMSGDRQVAFYALAIKIKTVLTTSVAALGPVLLPRISYCLSHGQEAKFHEYIRKSLHFVVLISIPITLYFVMVSPQVVDVLGGQEYAPAVICMRIITLAVIPLGIGNVACQQILAPMGKEKLTMYSTIWGAVINFFANMLLIPKFGASGAATATVLAESIIACIQIVYVWKVVQGAFKRIPLGKIVLSTAVAFTGLIVTMQCVKIENSLLYLILSGTVFFALYGVSTIALRDRLVLEYAVKLLKTKHK